MHRRTLFALILLALGVSACRSPEPTPRAAPARPPRAVKLPMLAVTSQERWRVPMPTTFIGIPTTTASEILVTTEQSVVALRHDGSVLWSTPLDKPRLFAPVVDRDLVLVSGEQWLTALRRDTGQVVWSFPTEPGEGGRANRASIASDLAIMATDAGRVVAVDRATGSLAWEAALGSGSGAQIAILDNVAVVVGIAEWAAFDATTGSNLWSGDIGFIGTSSPVTVDTAEGPLAVVASENKLIAVGLRDGQIRWTAHAEQSEPAQVPVVRNDELLVPDHWGRLTAYSPEDGRVLWRSVGEDGVALFGEPIVLGERTIAMALAQDGPRIASNRSSVALRPPAQGSGIAQLADGGLVVSTFGEGQNYLVAYDLDLGE